MKAREFADIAKDKGIKTKDLTQFLIVVQIYKNAGKEAIFQVHSRATGYRILGLPVELGLISNIRDVWAFMDNFDPDISLKTIAKILYAGAVMGWREGSAKTEEGKAANSTEVVSC